MTRAIHGGYRQQPGGFGLSRLITSDGPVAPGAGKVLRLPAPFQAFDPKFVSAGVALPIIRPEVDQDPDPSLITANVRESNI